MRRAYLGGIMFWRKVVVSALLLVIVVSLPLTTLAQENPPRPTLAPITAENVDQLAALERVESPLPGSLAWLPDNRTLAAGTTEGVFLYDVYNLDRAPTTLPAWQDVRVDQTAEVLISGGQWWDWQTGETRPAVGDSATRPYVYSPDQRQMATYALEDDEAVIRLWEVAQPDAPPLLELHTGLLDLDTLVFHPTAPVLAISGGSTKPYDLPVIVQLWNYVDGSLITTLVDRRTVTLSRLQFIHQGQYLLSIISDVTLDGPGWAEVFLTAGTTGELVAQWTLPMAASLTLNPDETLLVVDTINDNQIHVFDLRLERETQALSYVDSRTFGQGKRAPNAPNSPFGRARARSTPVYLFAPQFTPDGQYLITAGDVSTAFAEVLLWAVQVDGRIVGPVSLFETACCISNFAFSPDGAYLWIRTQTQTVVHRFPSGESPGHHHHIKRDAEAGRPLWTGNLPGERRARRLESLPQPGADPPAAPGRDRRKLEPRRLLANRTAARRQPPHPARKRTRSHPRLSGMGCGFQPGIRAGGLQGHDPDHRRSPQRHDRRHSLSGDG